MRRSSCYWTQAAFSSARLGMYTTIQRQSKQQARAQQGRAGHRGGDWCSGPGREDVMRCTGAVCRGSCGCVGAVLPACCSQLRNRVDCSASHLHPRSIRIKARAESPATGRAPLSGAPRARRLAPPPRAWRAAGSTGRARARRLQRACSSVAATVRSDVQCDKTPEPRRGGARCVPHAWLQVLWLWRRPYLP